MTGTEWQLTDEMIEDACAALRSLVEDEREPARYRDSYAMSLAAFEALRRQAASRLSLADRLAALERRMTDLEVENRTHSRTLSRLEQRVVTDHA